MPNPKDFPAIFVFAKIRKLAGAALCLALAACASGGSGSSEQAPAEPAAIADPLGYLAQSKNCDGNPATPLHQSEPITCRRFDYGAPPTQPGFQASDSFLADGGAITTWSYPPFGAFIAANGDGGEHYRLDPDGSVWVDATEDGGKPGVQHLVGWWLFDTRIPDCAKGWRYGTPQDRACTAMVTAPGIGPVKTIVSEHDDGTHVERFLLGLGWGRWGWMAFYPSCSFHLDPARTPSISAFDGAPDTHPGWVKCDERLTTRIIAADGSLTGLQEWHP